MKRETILCMEFFLCVFVSLGLSNRKVLINAFDEVKQNASFLMWAIPLACSACFSSSYFSFFCYTPYATMLLPVRFAFSLCVHSNKKVFYILFFCSIISDCKTWRCEKSSMFKREMWRIISNENIKRWLMNLKRKIAHRTHDRLSTSLLRWLSVSSTRICPCTLVRLDSALLCSAGFCSALLCTAESAVGPIFRSDRNDL